MRPSAHRWLGLVLIHVSPVSAQGSSLEQSDRNPPNAAISDALLIGNLQAGAYTLTMHGDGRAGATPNDKFGFLAGGVELGSTSSSLTTTLTALTPSVDNISAAHAQLGQDIRINLGTNGGIQPMFDNLQLDDAARRVELKA